MEMSEVLDEKELQFLKASIDRNFYQVKMEKKCTELTVYNRGTNEEMLKRFYFERKIEGVSENSLNQYVREAKKLLCFLNKHYSQIETVDIQYYLAYLMSKKSMSQRSVDNTRKFIKPFFKWLFECEYIPKDIFIRIKPIKYEDKQKEHLTESEIVRLRDACMGNARETALIDFLLSTGVRVSECSNLKLNNIDFATGEVNVYSNKVRKWRKVYLDSTALKHLTDYVNSRNDFEEYVFVNNRNTRMRESTIEKEIKKCFEKANLSKHGHVHLFRKTLATRLLKRGMDIVSISKILGHTSVKTTEKYYASVCEQDVKIMFLKCA